MPIPRERPYSAFNFLVQVGTGGDPTATQAGFQEVSGLGIEVTVQEYRPGNSLLNSPIKIPGLHKVTDVTLKRGLIGVRDLYEWIHEVRTGAANAARPVIIQLLNEDHTQAVMEWKLTNAVPIKYTGPAFNGKGTDVAIEELVLAVEQVEISE
jgi:phage tail-like protein